MSSKPKCEDLEDIKSETDQQVRPLVKGENSFYKYKDCIRLAFENANVGMCLVDLEGRLLEVNRHMCDIFGYSKEEFEGMSVNDITHPDFLDVSPNYIKRASKGGDTNGEFQKKYIHKKGHIVWGQVSSSLVRDTDGRPHYFISYVKDITDTRAAEEKLHDSEKRYRSLLANLDTAVVVHASDTRILLSNFRAQELLGLSDANIANRKDIDPEWYFVRDDGTRMPVKEYPVNIVITTLKPLQYYLVGINHPINNNIVWVEVNAFPEFDDDGNLRQIVVTFWDVTKRKTTEDSLAKQTLDLVNINKELRRQITERKQVEEKLRNQQRQADKDLEVAATIQQTLIPRYSPRIGPIRFAWRFEPCEQIGGDIFNFQYTGKNDISFYMFDVCGHGVSSALIAAAVSQFLQTSCEPMVPAIGTPRPDSCSQQFGKSISL